MQYMKTEELLLKAHEQRKKLEQIEALENDYAQTNEKVTYLRNNSIKIIICASILHLFGGFIHPIIPLIGLLSMVPCIVLGWKVISLDDKLEKLEIKLKEQKSNLSKCNTAHLLALPAPKSNIQYQDSITTYDKKIVRANKR